MNLSEDEIRIYNFYMKIIGEQKEYKLPNLMKVIMALNGWDEDSTDTMILNFDDGSSYFVIKLLECQTS